MNANTLHVAAARNARDSVVAADGALLACLALAITKGAFTPEHLTEAGYPENSAKTLASTWNRGHVAACIIGAKAAQDVITEATKGLTSRRYESAVDALRRVQATAEAAGVEVVKEKGRVVGAKKAPGVKLAAAIARDAVKASEAEKAKGPSERKLANAPTVSAALRGWSDGMAQLRLISNQLHAMEVPEGRESVCKDVLALLAEACETGAPLLRKVAK